MLRKVNFPLKLHPWIMIIEYNTATGEKKTLLADAIGQRFFYIKSPLKIHSGVNEEMYLTIAKVDKSIEYRLKSQLVKIDIGKFTTSHNKMVE
jgi:hypothetical protein